MRSYEIVTTDILVIGGGGAASRAAISASDAGADVVMSVKGKYGNCGSTSAAFAETTMITGAPLDDESNESLYSDTFAAGMDLISPELLRILVRDCGERVRDLEKFGLKLHRRVYDDIFSSGFAHSTPRTFIVESRLQHDILRVLVNQVRARPIKVLEQIQIARLLGSDGRLVGALGVDRDNRPVLFKSACVILAGGGAHGLYPHHPSTGDLIGDSFAMAYHAGLTMVNMDIIQMGPVGIRPIKRILSAPNWRLKPVLTNALGNEFLQKYLPNDVSADEIFRIAEFPYTVRTPTKHLNWAIFTEIMEGRGGETHSIWFDLTRLGTAAIREQAPFTYDTFKQAGLDLAESKLPVSIGVQTFHGGCLINTRAATELNGLFACGEAAGGLMGAERPGGNALAECQVFGNIAGLESAASVGSVSMAGDDELCLIAEQVLDQTARETDASFAYAGKAIQELMFESCLTIRNKEKLTSTLNKLEELKTGSKKKSVGLRDQLSACNALTAAELIVRASLERRESRGCHYRSDYPNRDAAFDRPIVIRQQNGKMQAGPEDLL
jgi:fumarate reductase (CoM/CoB) subunit A